MGTANTDPKVIDSKLNGETTEDLNMQLISAAQKLDFKAVQMLLAAGASAAFVHDPEGVWGSRSAKSALHVAISSGRRQQWDEAWPIVESLIQAKADVNALRSEYDWRGCGSDVSAFEMVLPEAMKDAKLLETFLKSGANANTKSVRNVHSMRTDGHSIHYVIHKGVQGGDLEVVRALLDAGADVDAVASDVYHNERGYNEHKEETALHLACARDDLAMVALLIARGANIDAVRISLEREHVEVESTTDDPRDPEYICPVRCIKVEETAIHMAIRNQNPNLLLMLACAGADVGMSRVRGDVATSTTNLCNGNEELLTALKAQWTPKTHHLFPVEVQESVKTALLIAKRQKWPLPDSVLFKTFAMAA
jgi:ankyrin repeat protein